MLYFETIGSQLSLMLLTAALQFGALNCSRQKNAKKSLRPNARKPIPVTLKTPKPSPHTPATNISPYHPMQSPLVKIKTIPRKDREKAKKKASLNARKSKPVKHKTPKPSGHKRAKKMSPYNDMKLPLAKTKTTPKNEKEKKIAEGKMVRLQRDFPAMQNQNLSDSLRSSTSSGTESEVPSMSDEIVPKTDDVPTEIEKVKGNRAKESKNKGSKKTVKKKAVEKSVTVDE